MPVSVSHASLEDACQRVYEHYLVHENNSLDEQIEALEVLMESVGIGDDSKEAFIGWVTHTVGIEYAAPALLGLVVGLLAAQFDNL